MISERLRREAPLTTARIERMLREAAAEKERNETTDERAVSAGDGERSTRQTKKRRSSSN